MWIHRQTTFLKPDFMAEALAHVSGQVLPPGTSRRLLRPIAGPEAGTKLVFEYAFGEGMAEPLYAAMTSARDLDEFSRKWITFSENRGIHELLKVVHEVPAAGKAGDWVDRRIVYVQPGRMADAIAFQKSWGKLDVEGFSYRVLTPRTGTEAGSILVTEATFSKLAEFDAAVARYAGTPEGARFLAQWIGVNQNRGIWELYRVIG
jgi:hypothetical protein